MLQQGRAYSVQSCKMIIMEWIVDPTIISSEMCDSVGEEGCGPLGNDIVEVGVGDCGCGINGDGTARTAIAGGGGGYGRTEGSELLDWC